MIGDVSDNNVCYVDFGASNHMTNHGKWFKDTRDLKTPRLVEIGDDTTHPITQIGKVPLSMQNGRTKYYVERCILCSNHNKKFSPNRPDGETRFIGDIQP